MTDKAVVVGALLAAGSPGPLLVKTLLLLFLEGSCFSEMRASHRALLTQCGDRGYRRVTRYLYIQVWMHLRTQTQASLLTSTCFLYRLPQMNWEERHIYTCVVWAVDHLGFASPGK